MTILIQAIAVVGGGWLMFSIWKLSRPQRYFTIQLIDGEPKAVQGKVTGPELSAVREVAKFNGWKQGKFWAVPGPMGMRLEFAKSVPEPVRQQLRNSWGAMGWKTRVANNRKR